MTDDTIYLETDQPAWHLMPGDPASKVILHVPHASRHIPSAERGRFLLDGASLEAELDAITDADTDDLAESAAERTNRRPWLFRNRNSRLLVDPERFPDEREEMLEVGMGPVYQRTTDGQPLRTPNPGDDKRLMNRYYWPYARAFDRLVEDRLNEVGEVLIIDLHSYPREPLPYELHSDQVRPSLCIGTDPTHTPSELVATAKSAWSGSTELNQPFSGSYVPERFLETESQVNSIMLEVRRDVIDSWRSESPATRGESPIVNLVLALVEAA